MNDNFGLLSYTSDHATYNVGDYIQSLAAKRFLGPKVTLIDREGLSRYQGPSVRMIMNGWFTHDPSSWPPAPQIEPLFV